MNRKIKQDLENVYGSMFLTEKQQSMTVGDSNVGDLPGPAKETGPKGSGSEATDAKKEVEADASLQGDTVEKSKKGGKATSKFDELYQQVNTEVVSEETGDIESGNFNDAIGDFPPAGADEESAERAGDELGETKSKADLFRDLADAFTSLADAFADELGDDVGEMIDGETEIPEGEEIAGEAVESTPAPDSTAKLQSKGNMNVKGVKVVKKGVSSASSGQEDGGKPKNQPDSTLGPKTSLKSNGSGAAVDGKDASAFE